MAYICVKQFSKYEQNVAEFSKSFKLSDEGRATVIKALTAVKDLANKKVELATIKYLNKHPDLVPQEELDVIKADETKSVAPAVALKVADMLDSNADVALSKDEVNVIAKSLVAYAKTLNPEDEAGKAEIAAVNSALKELKANSKALPIAAAAIVTAAVLVTSALIGEKVKYNKGQKLINSPSVATSGVASGYRPAHIWEKGDLAEIKQKGKSILPKD